MNVYELVEAVGGEIVRGKARVRVGPDYVCIGYINGDNMDFTDEGRRMAAEREGAPAVSKKKPAKASESVDLDLSA